MIGDIQFRNEFRKKSDSEGLIGVYGMEEVKRKKSTVSS